MCFSQSCELRCRQPAFVRCSLERRRALSSHSRRTPTCPVTRAGSAPVHVAFQFGTVSSPGMKVFRGSMAGLCAPLSALRRNPHGYPDCQLYEFCDRDNGLYVLNWLLKPEEAVMLQAVSRLLLELPLFLMTAVATHLVMSFAQTLMHSKLGHHPMGGKFFRNHINFHHTYYSKDHLVSRTYRGDEGNNTPFFFIPVFLVGALAQQRGLERPRGASRYNPANTRRSMLVKVSRCGDLRRSTLS